MLQGQLQGAVRIDAQQMQAEVGDHCPQEQQGGEYVEVLSLETFNGQIPHEPSANEA